MSLVGGRGLACSDGLMDCVSTLGVWVVGLLTAAGVIFLGAFGMV